MLAVVLEDETDWDGWRAETRRLILGGARPEEVVWSVGENADLLASQGGPDPDPDARFTVSRALIDLARTVILAREPSRFSLLYRLVWRAYSGERSILEQTTDPDVERARLLSQAVRRDMHKMRAFVRFRSIADAEGARYVAWFEPSHFIVEANAPFFVRRFATIVWSILTPDRSAHWDGTDLAIGPGANRAVVPDDDALEAYWRVYFSSIFNPARLKIGAMTSEMPKKYWKNLPEAAAIPDLIREASGRTEEMIQQSMPPPKPKPRGAPSEPHEQRFTTALGQAAHDASTCRRCPLWKPSTQTVFGEGPANAAMMLIGEQPGDQEDLIGRPFVGPAGQLLDRALEEAGIDRRDLYVTNAVKHFKFEPRGKRRIHQKPETPEIEACKFWLDIERAEIRPALLVLLGATAARAVTGRTVSIGRERGRRFILPDGQPAFITVHPSFLLRLPDEDAKAREYRAFVADLRQAAASLGHSG